MMVELQRPLQIARGLLRHVLYRHNSKWCNKPKNVTGAEINTRVLTGASVAYLSGAQIITKDEVNGAVYDTALAISKGGTGTVGKDVGILFGNMNGSHPVNVTGALISSTGSTTVDKGIDFTSYTFTGDILSAPDVGFKSTSIKANGSNATVELGSLSASNTPAVDFHSSGNNIDHDARIVCSGGTGVAGNGTLGVVATTLRPQPDNTTSLGQASNRWTEVFAVAGTINTSDEREKQDISSLDEAELRVATALKGLIKSSVGKMLSQVKAILLVFMLVSLPKRLRQHLKPKV